MARNLQSVPNSLKVRERLLVAVVNLTSMASIALGVAAYCFVALMFCTMMASSHLDPDLVWRRLEARE